MLTRPPIHAFVPSSRRVDDHGTSWPACAECGQSPRSGHTRRSSKSAEDRRAERVAIVERHRERIDQPSARVEPPASVFPRLTPASRPDENVGEPAAWQLRALALMLDEALHVELSYALRIQLLDAQRAVRSALAPTTVRSKPAVAPDPPKPAPSSPARSTPAPLGPGYSRIARGIRNDRERALYQRAVEAGWMPKVLGDGHLRLTSPSGAVFVLSMTTNGGGRSYRNDKAGAKRAGLDVSGL